MENSDSTVSIYVSVEQASSTENQQQLSNPFFVFQCRSKSKYVAPKATPFSQHLVRKTFFFDIPSFTFDEGKPSSQSWDLISKMISDMKISFNSQEPKRFYWKNISVQKQWKEVKNTEDIIKNILDVARCMVSSSSGSSMVVKFNKKVFLPRISMRTSNREEFLSAVQRKIRRLIQRLHYDDRRSQVPSTLRAFNQRLMCRIDRKGWGIEVRNRVSEMVHEQIEAWSHWELVPQVPAASGEASLEDVMVGENEPSTLSATLCAICREGYDSSRVISRMPCSHIFHKECILEWFKNGHACPLCRFELPTE